MIFLYIFLWLVSGLVSVYFVVWLESYFKGHPILLEGKELLITILYSILGPFVLMFSIYVLCIYGKLKIKIGRIR